MQAFRIALERAGIKNIKVTGVRGHTAMVTDFEPPPSNRMDYVLDPLLNIWSGVIARELNGANPIANVNVYRKSGTPIVELTDGRCTLP